MFIRSFWHVKFKLGLILFGTVCVNLYSFFSFVDVFVLYIIRFLTIFVLTAHLVLHDVTILKLVMILFILYQPFWHVNGSTNVCSKVKHC